MKIMHIIDSDGLHGAEIMLLNLMEEQRRMNLKPVLLSLGDIASTENSLEDEAKKRALDVIPFRMGRGYSLHSALAIARIARDENATLIHSHGYKGDVLMGPLPGRIRNMPMVRTQHGRTSTQKLSRIWMYEALDSLIMRGMDAVIQVSDPGGRREHVYPVGKRTFVIENGIPELKFDPSSAFSSDPAVREFCKEGFIIGTISRLSEEKGLVHLIDALRILRRHHAGVKTVILGDGPQRRVLQTMVDNAGLSGSILLAGYRNYAYHYLPHFDVFVLPSLTEGLPIVILEAMQAETPIVATRVGGIPALLENGKTGVLVRPGDPAALAAAISGVLSDPRGARAMAENARTVAVTNYSSRRMAESYQLVYETVVTNWRN